MNEFATKLSRHWEADSHIRVPTQPSQVLLWISDAAGKAAFLSPSWPRYTGLDRLDLLGEGWLKSVHPDDAPDLGKAFGRAAAENQGFRRKLRLRRSDGVYCGMVIESLPRLDSTGALEGFAGFCLDLSPAENSLLTPNLADHRITELIEHIHLPAIALDVDGNIIFFNQSFLDLVGDPAREVICRPFFGRYAESREEPLSQIDSGLLGEVAPHTFECFVRDERGDAHHLNWHVTTIRRDDGQLSCTVLIGDDITVQKRAEEHLLLTQRVFETTDQAMVVTDAKVKIISVNNAFTRLTGYSAAEALGNNPRILQSGRHSAGFYAQMWESLNTSGNWHGDIWDRRKDGSYYPKFLSISAIRDTAGKITHYCGIFHDISERKHIEEKLDRLAHYDALTGIPNRSLFFDRMAVATSQALRSGGEVAVLFVDLDRFKSVNDTLGHDAGDQLLREVAARISECVRGDDTAARLGGDEFAIVLPDVRAVANAARVAEKIIERLEAPFIIEGVNCSVSPSIGISLYPTDSHDAEQLLKLADQAMYDVKANGRGNYRFYKDTAPENEARTD